MSETSKRIVWAEFVCMILVVMQHAGVPKEIGAWQWYAISGFFRGIGLCAVPFFALVSGYFLSVHFGGPHWYGAEVRKRLRTILIPYLIWCVIGFSCAVVFGSLSDALAGRPWGTSVPLKDGQWMDIFGLNPTHLPLAFPLWYLRALLVAVIMSPVVACIFRLRLGLVWCLLLGAGYGVWAACMRSARTAGFLSIEFFFYFNVGVLIRNHVGVFAFCRQRGLRIVAFLIAFTVVCLGYYFHAECGTSLNVILACGIPGSLVALWGWAPICSDKAVTFMKKSIFPIFVLHVIFFIPFNFFFKGADSVVIMAARVGVSIALCILAAKGMRRWLPRFSQIAFGGR